MSYLMHNLGMIASLDERVRFPATEFVNYCDQKNLQVRIISARRTQAEQDLIYTKGRTRQNIIEKRKQGKLTDAEYQRLIRLYDLGKNLFDTATRTETLHSQHIPGLAIDLEFHGCSVSDIMAVAVKWNIQHPYPFDPPHFYLGNAKSLLPTIVTEPIPRPQNSFDRGIARHFGKLNAKAAQRLQKRLSLTPLSP